MDKVRKVATICGACSLAYPLLFWAIMLVPSLRDRANSHVSVGALFGFLVVALAISIVPAILISQKWLLATALHVSNLLYIGLHLH
jgi:hypothetical protein